MNKFDLRSDIAVDVVNAVPSLAAAARRRRMHHRHAKRRLAQVFVTASVVLATAAMLTPDVAKHAPLRIAAEKVSSLSVEPSWRRAGEVLHRKPGLATSLPFAIDPREIARRESLSRWHRIYGFSSKYRISPDLARKIFDESMRAGIEPDLAFRLVRVESVFNPRALSPVGAMGLTQLMYGTARGFDPKVTREQLFDAETNLRIGFKYLRALIRENRGNLRLALLTYNRGPVAVRNALRAGLDPANGYELVVMRGYRGRGTLD
ncbi:MAG: lytic transglycosylase domain-containing protein [Gemmatimonas sp.]